MSEYRDKAAASFRHLDSGDLCLCVSEKSERVINIPNSGNLLQHVGGSEVGSCVQTATCADSVGGEMFLNDTELVK